jgi:response regulator of citrate/malate metabolism
MDDKKFIDNYFAITENFQEFLKAIKKNYQSIDHLIVVLSVINHTKKTIQQTIQNSSNQPNSEAMSKEINQSLAEHPDYGVTHSSISRETNLPRTTVRRICDTFLKQKIFKKNSHGFIIMGEKMREQNQEMREETKKFFIEVAKNFKD